MTEQSNQQTDALEGFPEPTSGQGPVDQPAPVDQTVPVPDSGGPETVEAGNAPVPAPAAEPPAAPEVAAQEPVAAAPATSDSDAPRPEVADAESAEAMVVPVRRPAPAKATKGRKAQPEPILESTEPKSDKLEWYILKVQSNREESIREGLLRRVSIQGLDRYFGEIIVPTEKVTEFKGGKKRVIKRKLYPGYIVVHMEINEDSWFLVRETPGIGDFTGASGKPTPMLPHEVERIIAKQEEKSEKAPDLKIPFTKGDRVKIIEGNFENFEGEVDVIDKTNGRVTVMITIFNRTTPVEFEYWQVESV